jgi:hydrogenase expression/formation protein HypC
MCLAIPGEIVGFVDGTDRQLATVDVVGVRRRVNVGLLPDGEVGVGDWVLIHVGFALSRIDQAEAAATLETLERMGQAFSDELAAVAESSI